MQFTGKRYLDYSSFIKLTFGKRVQKIALDIGFSCPNRDGSKGYGGCTYCNNNTFNPDYCKPTKSIQQQLEEGIAFFSKKYKTQQYLAYFQAYTNTYSTLNSLKKIYEEALNVPKIVGLVIGTRPDCISEEIVDYLSFLSKKYFISLESIIGKYEDLVMKKIGPTGFGFLQKIIVELDEIDSIRCFFAILFLARDQKVDLEQVEDDIKIIAIKETTN